MHTHPKARLTPLRWERLLRRHIDAHQSLAELTAQAGISLRTAYKWLARYRSGGATVLVDRRSVRRTQRRMLDPLQLQRAVDLRWQRGTLRRIARTLLAPLTTVGRTLKALGFGRLKNLQQTVLVRRYKWAQPGGMVHADTKQLARVERVGHRITGDRHLRSTPGAGYEKAHVAIDDTTRLAYVEVLPDEKQGTTVGFLLRAVAWFNSQRHNGDAVEICRHRAVVYEQTHQRHPRRWSRSTRCSHQPEVVWINPPQPEVEPKPAKFASAA